MLHPPGGISTLASRLLSVVFMNQPIDELSASFEWPPLSRPQLEQVTAPQTEDGGEDSYLRVCQKLEELIEHKRSALAEIPDARILHRDLLLIGARMEYEPDVAAHEEDYLNVLKRLQKSFHRRSEARQLRREFLEFHRQLIDLGRQVGLEEPVPQLTRLPVPLEPPPISHPPPATVIQTRAVKEPPAASFGEPIDEDLNLNEIEKQISELQAQIRNLHENR